MSAIGAIVPRRNHWHRLLIAIGVFAGIIAVLPIAAALVAAVIGHDATSRTAFASAPPGNYAVYSTAGETVDQIRIASAANPDNVVFVTEVQHLPGYFARGSVSPSGELLALVVADGGTQSAPDASLSIVNLETGESRRIATGLDYLQDPVWEGDDAVLAVSAGEGQITLYRAPVSGSPATPLATYDATGVYPVGFTPDGELVTVILDGRGSTALVDGEEVTLLSPSITRDWELSPDGTQIAFIETDLTSGVNYLPRVAFLNGVSVSALAASTDSVQALGAAWSPNGEVTFGSEPGGSGGVLAQSAGFDVPLEYSADGASLAVHHWSGAGFDQPGTARYELITPAGRAELAAATRFFGWAER